MTFKIGAKEIGPESLLFVIEEGQANLGDFNKALAMIDAAATTKADAIEFQLARADDFYVKDAPGHKIYLDREFSNLQLKDLITYTKNKKLEFIATPLSHKLIEPLANFGCSGLSINASDLTNPDIIDATLDCGLPFFLCLPLAKEEEIDWAAKRITRKGSANFIFMHGQHTMASGKQGVDIIHTSLGYLAVLKKRYGRPVGFIDHTPLAWTPAAAVAAGANTVSKHLALSKAAKGPDWQVCLEPDEMKWAVNQARKMKESIKVDFKKLAPGENIDRSRMRRSIVAAKIIPVGKNIDRDDICFKRPGTGIDPSTYEDLLGKITLRDLVPDEQIKHSDLREAIL